MCKFWLHAGNQGTAYRRQNDVADQTPFVTALASAFDRGAVNRENGHHNFVLKRLPDGTVAKPTVTLQQLAAISFKVLVSCPMFSRYNPDRHKDLIMLAGHRSAIDKQCLEIL